MKHLNLACHLLPEESLGTAVSVGGWVQLGMFKIREGTFSVLVNTVTRSKNTLS